ncbi:nuclear transport factor 2 family protein [Pseudotenacibaculum sp. MALMAid0570]|uniref:nuclear transport factor 2 family protein n=1 Tax=Pseudotenacibaculum sp. MALMAid0570 TaxID=3143938 RepID=UPI0032DEBD9B
MSRIIVLLLLLISTNIASAQQETEEKAIKNVIETFFDGLHKGDSTIMKRTLHKEIKIQTTHTNRKGEKILKGQTRENLLIGVSRKPANVTYEEKLLSYDIKVDGNLASVWTPYEFYVNGNFSHCGANSFQLFNNNGTWEIIFLVDMRRKGNCDALKDKK